MPDGFFMLIFIYLCVTLTGIYADKSSVVIQLKNTTLRTYENLVKSSFNTEQKQKVVISIISF